VWNPVGATITIDIAPPWWGTWAFRSVATVVLGVGVIGSYRRRMSNIRRREGEKQERVLAAALESQESERQRIARDLHDGVGQVLAAVVLNLERVQELCASYHRGPNPLEAPLQRSMFVLKRAIGDVRTISHGLGTSTLRELGLVAAIAELLDNLATDATTFEFVTAGMTRRLAGAVEICLFRAAQELIANIVHHAGASEATIQIVRNEREVRLTVEDNGRGFVVDGPRSGMGLENVRARAAALRGEVHVDSAPGHGATITVVVATTHDLS
jgi:signal transduction histidine kinase